MDFSRLSEALASKSYEKVADICDSVMLQEITHSLSPLIWNPKKFQIS